MLLAVSLIPHFLSLLLCSLARNTTNAIGGWVVSPGLGGGHVAVLRLHVRFRLHATVAAYAPSSSGATLLGKFTRKEKVESNPSKRIPTSAPTTRIRHQRCSMMYQAAPTTRQLLSVKEVCEELGMSKSWVYQRIHSEEIPSIKLGGSIKVKREDLQGYVEGYSGKQPHHERTRLRSAA